MLLKSVSEHSVDCLVYMEYYQGTLDNTTRIAHNVVSTSIAWNDAIIFFRRDVRQFCPILLASWKELDTQAW